MQVNAAWPRSAIIRPNGKGSAMTIAHQAIQPRKKRVIAGTSLFDGAAAAQGYALNAMCYSFNDERNREAFRADEEAYCERFGLTPPQRAAVASRNVLAMIAAGGNIYYLAKLAGIFGLNVQDVGAQQTGMTVEAFRQKLLAEAEN
jgi:protocatechuate 4,5-dioxygenase alpha chain